MKKYYSLVFLVIIFLAIFLRFYQLGNVPAGLTNDEADIGYDAYSILLTGHDQWNASFPVSGFKGFGDYRPVLYTYFVIPSVFVFGLTPLAVRLPSAIFGILSVILIFFLTKKLFGKEIGLAAAFLFAISPWSIGMSHLGVESNVALFFLLLGFLLLTKVEKKSYFLSISILSFMATIYLYTAYTLYIPLVFIVLFISYRKYLVSNLRTVITSVLVFFILIIPFLSLKNIGFATRASTEGFFVNTTSIGTIQNINEKRGDCLKSMGQTICKLIANKPLEFGSVLIKNYINHFSFSYLYLFGTDVARTILPEIGLENTVEIIFLLIGLFLIVTKRNRYGLLMLILFLLSAIPDSLTGIGNFSRSSIMLPFLIVIEAIGLMGIIRYLTKNYHQRKNIIFFVFIFVFFCTITLFFFNYFFYFKTKYSSKYVYEALSNELKLLKNKYNKIYLSRNLTDSQLHIFYLFYNKYDPKLYQKKNGVAYTIDSNHWVSINKINNIYFVDKLPVLKKERVLFIGSPKDFPENVPVRKEIKTLKGDVDLIEVDSDALLLFEQKLCHDDNNCILKSGWFE